MGGSVFISRRAVLAFVVGLSVPLEVLAVFCSTDLFLPGVLLVFTVGLFLGIRRMRQDPHPAEAKGPVERDDLSSPTIDVDDRGVRRDLDNGKVEQVNDDTLHEV